MPKTLVFVNYEHPSHIKERSRRQAVSQHTGRYSQQLLRTRYTHAPHKEHIKDSSVYFQPRVIGPVVQPAQALTNDIVHVSPRPLSRQGLIVREKRRCVFNWQFRHLKQPSAPHNADWASYDNSPCPKSHELPVTGKADETESGRDSTPFRRLSQSQSPLSLLGQGRIDPFARFAINEDDSHIHELIDHGQSWLSL